MSIEGNGLYRAPERFESVMIMIHDCITWNQTRGPADGMVIVTSLFFIETIRSILDIGIIKLQRKSNLSNNRKEKLSNSLSAVVYYTLSKLSYPVYNIYCINYTVHIFENIIDIFSFDICCESFWRWIILLAIKKKEYFSIVWEILVYYSNGILVINCYSKPSGRFFKVRCCWG